ncbi:sugar ABC transporter permease [Microbacterium esteraromaticum]|uniref:Sugar ABC transporter permease n=1 Tax=Microbacterium esteraromaticum TaxID=57043 RepID=A0A7D7WH38_9MICO|nr:sugar ABC transporter permease [Microbacterium esteraromaticum]QMU96270.1 sugar ABC transporter permease [Microbacterium esteraromaticum]
MVRDQMTSVRGGDHVAAPNRGRRRRRGTALAALAFLAPALAALILLRLLPAGLAVRESFFARSFFGGGEIFVGFERYAELFTSPDFLNSLQVTLVFAIIINPLQVGAAFLLAYLYTRRAAGSRIWRSFVILPIAAPAAVAAVVWSVIYRPDGLANALLAVFGIPAQPFLNSPDQSLAAIIVLLSWTAVGYYMLFLIAGINDIPAELYEAASIDGASAWHKLWHITLPMCRRPLAFVLVADTVHNFLVFAPVQILTQGGPQGSTDLLMYDIYERAYTLGDTNAANAEVVVLVVITLLVVLAQFRLLGGEKERA